MKLRQMLLYCLFTLIVLSVTAQKTSKHADSAKHRIRGVVTVWRSKSAIQGVQITTRGAKKEETMRGIYTIANGVGVQTDSCGRFEMFLPDSMIGKKITLLFYKNHYVSKTIDLKTWKLPARIKIKMEKYDDRPGEQRFL